MSVRDARAIVSDPTVRGASVRACGRACRVLPIAVTVCLFAVLSGAQSHTRCAAGRHRSSSATAPLPHPTTRDPAASSPARQRPWICRCCFRCRRHGRSSLFNNPPGRRPSIHRRASAFPIHHRTPARNCFRAVLCLCFAAPTRRPPPHLSPAAEPCPHPPATASAEPLPTTRTSRIRPSLCRANPALKARPRL